MSLFRRKRVTIDYKIQGALCLRICCYWLACMASAILLFAARPLLEGTLSPHEFINSFWAEYFRPMAASFLLLPMVLLDSLIFSNRIAGPLYRFRLELAKLAAGKPARHIILRPGDYATDMADSINKLIEAQDESTAIEVEHEMEQETVEC